uniref:MFS transporter n=1 Tax=Citrobacter amalonaticus TaxID=35703 RepID=UPI000A79D607
NMSGDRLEAVSGRLSWEWISNSSLINSVKSINLHGLAMFGREVGMSEKQAFHSLISPFLTVGVVASILAMIATTWVTKFWDKIKMFRYTQLMTFALSLGMYLCVGQQNLILAFVFYFLINFFCDMQMPVFWSSIAEAVDYGEKKTGLRVSGLAFGGILFFQKFGMGIAGGVLGFLLSHFGYQADVQQSASSLTGIALMMTLIPAVFHLVVGVVMKKYLINNDYYRDIQSELAQRQA